MDNFEISIEDEIQKAEIQTDCELDLIDCDLPEMGSLVTHTANCERSTEAYQRHQRKHRRRKSSRHEPLNCLGKVIAR